MSNVGEGVAGTSVSVALSKLSNIPRSLERHVNYLNNVVTLFVAHQFTNCSRVSDKYVIEITRGIFPEVRMKLYPVTKLRC
jgi:hypothetical protein